RGFLPEELSTATSPRGYRESRGFVAGSRDDGQRPFVALLTCRTRARLRQNPSRPLGCARRRDGGAGFRRPAGRASREFVRLDGVTPYAPRLVRTVLVRQPAAGIIENCDHPVSQARDALPLRPASSPR